MTWRASVAIETKFSNAKVRSRRVTRSPSRSETTASGGVLPADLILEQCEEDRREIDFLNDGVGVRIGIVADEHSAQPVGREAEIGLELALAEPVAHLPGTVFARIQLLVRGFGFDQ